MRKSEYSFRQKRESRYQYVDAVRERLYWANIKTRLAFCRNFKSGRGCVCFGMKLIKTVNSSHQVKPSSKKMWSRKEDYSLGQKHCRVPVLSLKLLLSISKDHGGNFFHSRLVLQGRQQWAANGVYSRQRAFHPVCGEERKSFALSFLGLVFSRSLAEPGKWNRERKD